MARKRYPSDEAKLKRPSGMVVAFSIRNPDPNRPGHADVFEDPEKRGIWLGLLVVAGQSFAGRHGDLVTLSTADLSWVTGRTHRAPALGALRVVCECMGYAVDDRGRSVVVHVKNLSQNQGWTPPNSAESTRSSAEFRPPPSPSPSPKSETTTPPESGAEPPRAPPEKSPWLNLLKGKPPNGYESAEAWLDEHLPIVEGEVDAELGATADATQRNGKIKSLLCRYWRNKSGRGPPARGIPGSENVHKISGWKHG